MATLTDSADVGKGRHPDRLNALSFSAKGF